MIRYKLTGSDGTTRGDMLWEPGRTNRTKGKGRTLCSDGVIHVYETALQAAYMRPAHVPTYTRLWEVEVPAIVADDGTCQGVRKATAIREIELPEIEVSARVEIAIRVALRVYHDPTYVAWAARWLRGEDRSEASARTEVARAAEAALAADKAPWAAAHAAGWATGNEPWTGSWAAWAVAYAAWAEQAQTATMGGKAASARTGAIIPLCSIIEEVLG